MTAALIFLMLWLFVLAMNAFAVCVGMIYAIWTLPPDRSFVGRGLRWNCKLQRYEAGRKDGQ